MASRKNFDDEKLQDHISGTIYGNCIGDAMGLLTEFMTKEEAAEYYAGGKLEYSMKVNDGHRCRWKDGDWTDDSDQMILIMKSIMENNGKVNRQDFGQKLDYWRKHGMPEFGDYGGMGIGTTTHAVLIHPEYKTDPHLASKAIWEEMGSLGRWPAPNGGVMRTSILGIHQYNDINAVITNTIDICKTTHHDPRCVASCVAVTTAIAMMLQKRPECLKKDGSYKTEVIAERSYNFACNYLTTDAEKKELRTHMFPKHLRDLNLSEPGKIGYTYKTLGAGFWAFQKDRDFRYVMQKLIMEAGDADTNGAVAGALLGCKLGLSGILKTARSWWEGLKYQNWLEDTITKFLDLQISKNTELDATRDQEKQDATQHANDNTATKAGSADSEQASGNDITENIDEDSQKMQQSKEALTNEKTDNEANLASVHKSTAL